MSLKADIESLIDGVRAKAPPQVFETLGGIFDRLAAEGVAAQAPKPGDAAPRVDLLAADGATVSLATLFAGAPLALLFYRGRWCPFCDLTLRAFERVAPEFGAAGVSLAAVSPQTLSETLRTGSERELSFPLYSDPGNAAARAFGLDWQVQEGTEREFYRGFGSHVDRANGDDEWRLPAPAAFVIDTAGVVRWAWTDTDWTHRPEPTDVLAAARSIAAAPA